MLKSIFYLQIKEIYFNISLLAFKNIVIYSIIILKKSGDSVESLDRSEINKRREMSKQIVNYLKGRTGNNFQNDMNIVLKKYYDQKNKTFEMPQAMRGDYKNDGWIIEDNIYFMMYSPVITKASNSFYDDIQKKFKSDLKGLLINVYEKKMWGKEVKSAILLVNSKDNRLPPDNNRAYEEIAKEYKEKYDIDFESRVVNLDYIEEMLEEIPSNILDDIMFKLNMARDVDYNEPNATDIIKTIGVISKNVIENYTNNLSSDYKRISTPKKIKINNLDDIKEDIEQIISKLGVVDNAVKEMSQDMTHIEQFNCTKNYIINKYSENVDKYKGVDLFNFIIEEISRLFPNEDNRINEIRYLVVYIFDKCDIFEKEEVEQ